MGYLIHALNLLPFVFCVRQTQVNCLQHTGRQAFMHFTVRLEIDP